MTKENKKSNKKNKEKNNKYDAENEIIIGVTTKPKKEVRVEKKSTRTNNKNIPNKKNKTSNNKKKKNIRNELKQDNIKKKNKKKIIISIGTLLLILLGCGIYYLTTPVFNVTNIIIYGNNKNSSDTYVSLSKIIIGETNIFSFTQSSIKKNIKENSYVEDIELKRKLPNTLEIKIKERKVDYQLEYIDKYIYLDKQGYILEINDQNAQVPIIKGCEAIEKNIEIGQRLNNNDLMKLDTVLKIANYCEYNNIDSKLTSIDASNVTNYILNFDGEDKIVYIGNSSSLTEKMTVVAKILSNEKGKKGEIFADEDALKRNRVYFREEE